MRIKRFLGRLALALLVPFFVLASIEGALRWLDIGSRPAPFVLESSAEGTFYRTNDRYDVDAFPGRNAVTDVEQCFSAQKSPGQKRVFFLGASTVFGAGFHPHASPPKWLDVRLTTVLPDFDIEVINCGIPGADSRSMTRIARDIIAFEPDLVVVYTGHNELLWPNIHAMTHPWDWAFRELCTDTHLLRLMVEVLIRETDISFEDPTNGREGPVFVDPFVSEDLHRQALVLYREHLEEIDDALRAEQIPWLICVPACRILDVSPVQSAFTGSLAKRERDRINRVLRDIPGLLDDSRFVEALDSLDQVLSIDMGIALAHYLRGKALRLLDRPEEARRALLEAWRLDRYPNRAGPDFLAVVRDFARTRNVPLADVFERFERESSRILPGEELFIDHCHPTLKGQGLMSAALVDVIRAEMDVFPKDAWRMDLDKDLDSYLAEFAMDPAQLASTYHQKSLANLRTWLVMSRATREELDRALDAARKACEWSPNEPRYLGVLGLINGFRDEVETGKRQIMEAQSKDPTSLTDLAELITKSPRLNETIRGWGLDIEKGRFVGSTSPGQDG